MDKSTKNKSEQKNKGKFGVRIKIFTDKVKEIVRKIPKGSVLTYKQVAKMAGSPSASRAVGTIMKNNYDKTIPCHRVIKSDGKVGEYNRGGSKKKMEILLKEKAFKTK